MVMKRPEGVSSRIKGEAVGTGVLTPPYKIESF
jgi:hypothetical protein